VSDLLATASVDGSEGGRLEIHRSEDGDIWVTVWDAKGEDAAPMAVPRSSIRICTRAGGGKSPETRKALYQVMEAIRKDGGETSP
jgi:hypothetical protein